MAPILKRGVLFSHNFSKNEKCEKRLQTPNKLRVFAVTVAKKGTRDPARIWGARACFLSIKEK